MLTESRSGCSFLGWKKSVTEEDEAEERLEEKARGGARGWDRIGKRVALHRFWAPPR